MGSKPELQDNFLPPAAPLYIPAPITLAQDVREVHATQRDDRHIGLPLQSQLNTKIYSWHVLSPASDQDVYRQCSLCRMDNTTMSKPLRPRWPQGSRSKSALTSPPDGAKRPAKFPKLLRDILIARALLSNRHSGSDSDAMLAQSAVMQPAHCSAEVSLCDPSHLESPAPREALWHAPVTPLCPV